MISRYLLLLLFNIPFIVAGLVNIVAQYKLRQISRSRLIIWLLLWGIILAGLILAEPAYNLLSQNGLTASDSLSLFDVVQITAIVVLFYVTNRMRLKLEIIERRFKYLHEELSIKLKDK